MDGKGAWGRGVQKLGIWGRLHAPHTSGTEHGCHTHPHTHTKLQPHTKNKRHRPAILRAASSNTEGSLLESWVILLQNWTQAATKRQPPKKGNKSGGDATGHGAVGDATGDGAAEGTHLVRPSPSVAVCFALLSCLVSCSVPSRSLASRSRSAARLLTWGTLSFVHLCVARPRVSGCGCVCVSVFVRVAHCMWRVATGWVWL